MSSHFHFHLIIAQMSLSLSSPFLSPITITAVLLLLSGHLPPSSSQTLTTFPNCTLPFSCGSFLNITYPFTGGDRPAHCGPPEFQLTCRNNFPELTTNSFTYRVLNINQTQQTMNRFTCFCRDRPYPDSCFTGTGGQSSANTNRLNVVLTVVGAILAGIGFGWLFFFCRQRRKRRPFPFMAKKNKQMFHKNVEAFLTNHGSLAPKRYSYSNIKKITNSFADKLGEGGYGSVYKGKFLDGRFVAVKTLTDANGDGGDFVNEVASISRTSHVNIVTLLGFCLERNKRALVYEFMPNKSLDKYIHKSESSFSLDLETLYKVAVGTARGLEYLHRGCNTRIVHFDIKPENILLDEEFCPKISDFGLAKLCQRKISVVSMIGARGTPGYIAPEVFSRSFGEVSHKSDVYSYGMMVINMIGVGEKNDLGFNSTKSEMYFPDIIYKRLELMSEDVEEETSKKMVLVSLWCIQTNPLDRPSMGKVVEMLEGNIELIQIPPKPFLFSHTRVKQDSCSPSSSSYEIELMVT